MQTLRFRSRRGFTILEMIISMSLMLALIGMSVNLFRKQSTLVSAQSGRLDAQQNGRYAMGLLERELRMAGVGVVDAQPLLVEAGALAITFNANIVSTDTGDYTAVYIDAGADSAATDVLRNNNKITLPLTSKLYPDSTYLQSPGVPSLAETISFWLAPDTTVGGNPSDYALYRRVNAMPAKVVAHGLLYTPGDVVFQYIKADSAGNLTTIPAASLPLIHTAPVHGSAADTGSHYSAITDSIKEVKFSLRSVYHDKKLGKDVERDMTSTIHLMNAGLVGHTTCGQPPIAVSSVSPTVTAANGTTIPASYVTITWNASTDEFGGEKDVERYTIFRRLSSVATFDAPFASIAAGQTSYNLTDYDVQSGDQWIYGVAANDCSPASSPITQASQVTIP